MALGGGWWGDGAGEFASELSRHLYVKGEVGNISTRDGRPWVLVLLHVYGAD